MSDLDVWQVRCSDRDLAGLPLTLWPGRVPEVHLPEQGTGRPLAAGHWRDREVWVESSMPGARLTDLLPLEPSQVDYLALELRRLVATLHGMGTVHGHLAADRVLVDTQGRPSMVGVGLVTSSVEDDLLALASMVKKMKGMVETSQAVSGALTQEALKGRVEQALEVVREGGTDPVSSDEIRLRVLDLATDELSRDPGTSEGEGLFDTWSHEERTAGGAERTDVLLDGADLAQRAQAALARLAAGLDAGSPGERFRRTEGSSVRELTALLARENPDPLAVPQCVPLVNPTGLNLPMALDDRTDPNRMTVDTLDEVTEESTPHTLETTPLDPLVPTDPVALDPTIPAGPVASVEGPQGASGRSGPHLVLAALVALFVGAGLLLALSGGW